VGRFQESTCRFVALRLVRIDVCTCACRLLGCQPSSLSEFDWVVVKGMLGRSRDAVANAHNQSTHVTNEVTTPHLTARPFSFSRSPCPHIHLSSAGRQRKPALSGSQAAQRQRYQDCIRWRPQSQPISPMYAGNGRLKIRCAPTWTAMLLVFRVSAPKMI
jgi:hypothetical protein